MSNYSIVNHTKKQVFSTHTNDTFIPCVEALSILLDAWCKQDEIEIVRRYSNSETYKLVEIKVRPTLSKYRLEW